MRSWNRTETWIGLAVAGVAVIVASVLGLFAYMSLTAAPIHPDKARVPSGSSSSTVPRWADAVERGRGIARAAAADQNLPGLSVAVGMGNEIVWAEGFGYADLEKRTTVTSDTRFRIGTTSTVLTSAALGLLIEKGQLKLDDEIQTYVPDYPKKQWPVTVRELMANTGGVRNDAGDEESITERCERTSDAIKRFADSPLQFEPGTQFRYSSYGWILLGAAIETASAEPFVAFMRSHVFEPLGMKHTTSDSGPEPAPDRATYYFPRFAADPRYGPQEPEEPDSSCLVGASTFVSTPTDLVRFGVAMNGGTLVRTATVKQFQESQRLRSGEETGYGLGWDIETATLSGQQSRVVGYDGTLRGGPVSSLVTFPERGIVVAVLSNTSFADTYSVAVGLAQVFAEPAKAK